MTRVILGILRKAAEPMTTRCGHADAHRAWVGSDDVKLLSVPGPCGVRPALQVDKSAVRSVEGPGQYMLWELIR